MPIYGQTKDAEALLKFLDFILPAGAIYSANRIVFFSLIYLTPWYAGVAPAMHPRKGLGLTQSLWGIVAPHTTNQYCTMIPHPGNKWLSRLRQRFACSFTQAVSLASSRQRRPSNSRRTIAHVTAPSQTLV